MSSAYAVSSACDEEFLTWRRMGGARKACVASHAYTASHSEETCLWLSSLKMILDGFGCLHAFTCLHAAGCGTHHQEVLINHRHSLRYLTRE